MSNAAVVARRSKPQNRIKASADAYVARMLADVNNVLNWATTNSVKLLISEFGWRQDDDSYAWSRFAEALYGNLVGGPDTWITAWIATETFPAHRLAVYRGTNYYNIGSPVTSLAERTLAGRIVEQHKGTGKGVNLGNMGENGMYGQGPEADVQPYSNTREVPVYGSTRKVTDGVTNSTTTFTSATAAFGASDVGALISGGSIPSATQINSVTNATTVVLSQAATASASGVTTTIIQRGTTFTFGSGQNLHGPDSPDAYFGGNYSDGWTYGSDATWAYLGARGVKLVRLPFHLERIYKTFNGALDTTEVGRITHALDQAQANGISVILDCHNFGVYYLDNGTAGVAKQVGGSTFTNAIFADFWTKMVTQFDSHPAVVCHEIMNEPWAAANWTQTFGPAQAAVTAIRAAGSTKCIGVSLAGFAKFQDSLPTPWITDSGNNLRYVVHGYFDYSAGNSSKYQNPYGWELAAAKTAGFTGTDSSPTTAPGPVTDTFNRPDIASSGQGTNSLGATQDAIPAYWFDGVTAWQDGSGNDEWRLVGGQAAQHGASTRVFVITSKCGWTLDVDLPVVGSSAGLLLRGSNDGATFLAVDIGGLYQCVASGAYGAPSFTQLGSWTSPGYASGDHLRITDTGTSVVVQRIRSGVTTTLATVTTSLYNTQTAYGLWCFSTTTTRWQNFTLS